MPNNERRGTPRRRARGAFTLLELLVVIALLAVLGGLLFPAAGVARGFAQKTRTRAQFGQWALAFEQFRADYGSYPLVDSSGRIDPIRFVAALTGHDPAGRPLTGASLFGNVRRARYYSPTHSEWLVNDTAPATGGELVDGFRNSQIIVMVDRDGDGVIQGPEIIRAGLAGGNSRDGFSPIIEPVDVDLAGRGIIRAGVAFYSAGRATAGTDYVFSWK